MGPRIVTAYHHRLPSNDLPAPVQRLGRAGSGARALLNLRAYSREAMQRPLVVGRFNATGACWVVQPADAIGYGLRVVYCSAYQDALAVARLLGHAQDIQAEVERRARRVPSRRSTVVHRRHRRAQIIKRSASWST